MKIGQPRKTENLKFKTPGARDTKYKPLFEAIENLNVGQSFLIDPDTCDPIKPKGGGEEQPCDATTLLNRLSGVLRRDGAPVAPKGYAYIRRQTTEGKVAVSFEEVTAATAADETPEPPAE